jgi:L-serine dehydratase
MISVFDLYTIGIGPSSSHTIGPMIAANDFVKKLSPSQFAETHYITIELFGSLAHTGVGHGTDNAILMGIEGHLPETIDPDAVIPRCKAIIASSKLSLHNKKNISFKKDLHLIFNKTDSLPYHTNAMIFRAFNQKSNELLKYVAYSVGGGFVIDDHDIQTGNTEGSTHQPPYPFQTTKDLLAHCKKQNKTIAQIIMENELSLYTEDEIKKQLRLIYSTMEACIEKGSHTPGILPGGLNVRRRAPDLFAALNKKNQPLSHEHIDSMSWLNLYAIAVNEENAAGGRVVTAPTNGAAGIIPAVLHYYLNFYHDLSEDSLFDFLLTAGAIAILFKKNASISGAEMGCQGEVGVACSMAAGALTAVLGGTLAQIENAAEIGIEHHLGMTCDPVGGLVQIPCIERNAMGAVKALNASRLALSGDGEHYISLDKAILTMKKTGEDMNSIYKETSLGGLAANTPEC